MSEKKSFFSDEWENAVKRSEDAVSIEVDRLVRNSVITVVTAEVTYRFVVIDPERLKVRVRSGDKTVTEGMIGYIQGSALVPNGAMRRAWVAVGYRIVFGSESLSCLPPYTELPKTLDLRVNGANLVPTPNSTVN